MSLITGEAVIAWPVCCSAWVRPTWSSLRLFSLLALLLTLPLDVELLLFAPEVRRGFPFELVPVDRQREIEGELLIHELPHGGKRQCAGLQFHVLELLPLLVRPGHRPGELAPSFSIISVHIRFWSP